MQHASLTRFAWLSIAAAVMTIAMKAGAYFLTGSVGLLSDALESLVNLAAACMALGMLTIAARPPDEEHAYGHNKAEYFSSGVEGALILVAAVSIGYTALERLLHPQPIEQIGLGLVISVLASVINWGVARVLFKAGRAHNSITLAADAKHLMTDVWTSAGVVVGVGAVALTGFQWLDSVIALLVAVNIVWSGVQLVRQSALGLLDTGWPAEEQQAITQILDSYAARGVKYHSLRTRTAGARRFMSVHILVPGAWTVQRGHNLLEEIEAKIRQTLPEVTVLTHLEPVEDPVSFEDRQLDRPATHEPASDS